MVIGHRHRSHHRKFLAIALFPRTNTEREYWPWQIMNFAVNSVRRQFRLNALCHALSTFTDDSFVSSCHYYTVHMTMAMEHSLIFAMETASNKIICALKIARRTDVEWLQLLFGWRRTMEKRATRMWVSLNSLGVDQLNLEIKTKKRLILSLSVRWRTAENPNTEPNKNNSKIIIHSDLIELLPLAFALLHLGTQCLVFSAAISKSLGPTSI